MVDSRLHGLDPAEVEQTGYSAKIGDEVDCGDGGKERCGRAAGLDICRKLRGVDPDAKRIRRIMLTLTSKRTPRA